MQYLLLNSLIVLQELWVDKMNSGIYIIKNIKNNKIYVGSSSDLKRREKYHFNMLLNNKHDNSYLQRSYNKYGRESFIFEIIEYIDRKDNLLDKENYWIKYYDSNNRSCGYNLRKYASSNLGIKWSEEVKKKISNSLLGEKNHNFGMHPSDEERRKISENRIYATGADNPKTTKKEIVLQVKKMLDKKMRPKEILKTNIVSKTTLYKIKNGYYKNIHGI